jgi:hypothetical protein
LINITTALRHQVVKSGMDSSGNAVSATEGLTTPLKTIVTSKLPLGPETVTLRDRLNMPEPIGNVGYHNALFAFGSEQLRVALLAGGNHAHCVKCPTCLSGNVRRASRATFYESCMRLFFLSPYRCRQCLFRFYAKTWVPANQYRLFGRVLASDGN